YFYFPGRSQPAFLVGPQSVAGTSGHLDHVEDLSRRVLMQDRVTRNSAGWMFNHPAGSASLTVFDSQSYYSLQVYTGGRDRMAGANLLFFDLSVRWVPG